MAVPCGDSGSWPLTGRELQQVPGLLQASISEPVKRDNVYCSVVLKTTEGDALRSARHSAGSARSVVISRTSVIPSAATNLLLGHLSSFLWPRVPHMPTEVSAVNNSKAPKAAKAVEEQHQ